MLAVSKSPVLEPPRLLAGLTLLYWGALTGEPVIGLIIAILLEAKNWVKWSWDFSEAAYVKAFQMSLGLLGLVLFFVWLGEINHNSLFQVMKWFPLCLLPVELAQRYGKSDRMNLNTFFFFSRQRMWQDRREGRSINPKTINTGYPYIFVVLLVASCSSRMDIYVQIAMMALMTIAIASVTIKRGLGWRRLIWALPLMLILTFILQSETAAIYKSYLSSGRAFKEPDVGESSPHLSTLGQLGKMKLNPEIQWRAWGDDVPDYLRLSSYNKHHGSLWSYDFQTAEITTMEDAFDSRVGIEVGKEGSGMFVFDREHEPMISDTVSTTKVIHLRGKGRSDTIESVVPSAEGLIGIGDMAGAEVRAAVHPLGGLKLVNRKEMIDYRLWITNENLLDSEPEELLDTAINESSLKAVTFLSKEMRLDEAESAREKVNVIRDFFMQEFTYALHFDVPETDLKNGSDLDRFMMTDRRGHCEYFATTAALLLRQQGIPTRYCVGYVVREKEDDTWIIRGSHTHAWCSAWIDGKWEIVDLTPPDWLSMQNEANAMSWGQGFKDWFQNVKQDFAIWRTDTENLALLNKIIWALGIMLLLWIAFRLYKARSLPSENCDVSGTLLSYQVPKDFVFIESQLARLIGKKSVAQTYYSWVNTASSKVDQNLFTNLSDLVNLHEQSRFGGVDKSEEINKISYKIKSLLK